MIPTKTNSGQGIPSLMEAMPPHPMWRGVYTGVWVPWCLRAMWEAFHISTRLSVPPQPPTPPSLSGRQSRSHQLFTYVTLLMGQEAPGRCRQPRLNRDLGHCAMKLPAAPATWRISVLGALLLPHRVNTFNPYHVHALYSHKSQLMKELHYIREGSRSCRSNKSSGQVNILEVFWEK